MEAMALATDEDLHKMLGTTQQVSGGMLVCVNSSSTKMSGSKKHASE
jgi:hypothetical protein